MPETQNQSYGSFLKPGDLKQPVTVAIEPRPCGPGMTEGACASEGKFGPQLTLAFNVSGIPKRVSMPRKGHDAKTLETVFGPIGDGWIGKRIVVKDDDNLSIIRVQPA